VIDSLLSAESATTGIERASLINTLQQRESADLEEAVAVRLSLDQTRGLPQTAERDLPHSKKSSTRRLRRAATAAW
jgi:hypothetical protein